MSGEGVIARGKWFFLSVVVIVLGALGGFAIWAFAIREDDGGPASGPAAPLTQPEQDALARFHELATISDLGFDSGDLASACDEVTAVVRAKPFGPYDTSAYADSTESHRWSPIPGTAHWAAAVDLEQLGDAPRLLRQDALRSLTQPNGEGGKFMQTVRDCHLELLTALESATV
jgi:hypothetical protein